SRKRPTFTERCATHGGTTWPCAGPPSRRRFRAYRDPRGRMSGFPNSPRLVKGGIVTLDVDTSVVKGVIALQYNPDSLSRTLQIQAVQGAQDGTRVDALRLRGPAVETIKIDAE